MLIPWRVFFFVCHLRSIKGVFFVEKMLAQAWKGTRFKKTAFKFRLQSLIWGFPKMVVPQIGWFMMEKPLRWMMWGYHHFRKPPYVPGTLNIHFLNGWFQLDDEPNLYINKWLEISMSIH